MASKAGMKVKLTKSQKAHEGKALCPDHAEYFEMPPGTFEPVGRTEDLGCRSPSMFDDADIIECEVCALAAMRKLGVI